MLLVNCLLAILLKQINRKTIKAIDKTTAIIIQFVRLTCDGSESPRQPSGRGVRLSQIS